VLAERVLTELDDGVLVLDRADRVVLANPAARAMGVAESGQLRFAPMLELAHRARAEPGKLRASVDLPISRLGREPIALAVSALAVDADWVLLLLHDLSEQRRLEAVRRDFVANVSHELKTPVGALAVLAEAIEQASADPAAVAHFSGRMRHEAARLTRLVQDLMELSRVQGIDPMPGAAEVAVAAVLGEAVDRARLAAERAGIDLQVSCAPGLTVRGDEAQLITAVANLVDNAVAYSGHGTRVAVVGSAASDRQGRPVVDIVVLDEGIGIEQADLERIFERFYRVDPARSRATGGTGLGLAIVRNIATNHLGSVSVRSFRGQGSTFTIRLPGVHPDASTCTGPAMKGCS
jgi:two-component system sensor histidine kinase SenX3